MANPENIRKLIDAKRRKEAAAPAAAPAPDATHTDLVAYVRANDGTKASDLMRVYKVSRNRAIAAVEEAARPAPEAPLPGQTAIPETGVEDVPPELAQAKENAEALVEIGKAMDAETAALGEAFVEAMAAPVEGDTVEVAVPADTKPGDAVFVAEPTPLLAHDPDARRLLPLALIDEHPANPRLLYPRLAELAADISENGLRDPIKVRPVGDRFEVFSGHRRLRAMKQIGWTETVALVEPMCDLAAYERVVVENEHREDLTAIEEGIAFQGLIERSATAEQVAKLVGKSVAHVYARMKLTALGAEGRAAMVAGWLTPETGLLVARIPTEALQIQALKAIGPDEAGGAPEAASYREARETIQRDFMLLLTKAPFSRTAADLCAGVGACSDCPKRSGALPAEIRTDLKGADICLDRDCYRAKTDAAWLLRKAAAAEEKIETIDAAEASQKHLVYTGDSLAEHNGICSLESTCHEDKEYRNWSKLLPKKAIPKPDVLIQSPLTGAAIPGWKRETLVAAAVEAGAIKAHAAADPGESQKEKEAAERKKIRERKQVGGLAIAQAVLLKMPPEKWPASVWRAVAEQAVEFQWGGPVAKRLGIEYQEIADLIPKATAARCAELTLHLMLQKTLEQGCAPYAGLDEKPFRSMLSDLGIDLKKVAEAAEEEPATAPEAKPARAVRARKVAAAKKKPAGRK